MAIKRTRTRRYNSKLNLEERALKMLKADEDGRTGEMDMRLQRYAKYRQWTDGSARPWDDASDAAMPDLATASLRQQDTVVNAVRGLRPCILPKATHAKDLGKVDNIAHTLDYQAFVENGPIWLDSIAEAWVNDGHYTLFIPWVRDEKEIQHITVLDPIPADMLPAMYFQEALVQKYANAEIVPLKGDYEDAWDYAVQEQDAEPFIVAFYTTPAGDVEMVETRTTVAFDGPRLIPVDRADIYHPPYCENLQPPGPANPRGAAHVVLVDRPTVDEIAGLQKAGWYDRATAADIEKMRKTDHKPEPNAQQDQKATMAGQALPSDKSAEGEERVTRLRVFDRVDIDGDGQLEDVVYWVIKEHKQLLRVRRLSEEHPSRSGKRPFAEAPYIRVSGQRTGMGILELAEGIHDLRKQLMDQSVDQGTFMLSPFFFYRPNSNLKEEVIKLWPGEGYPLSNPQQDINFPQLPPNGQAFALNMQTMLQADEERLTMVTDMGLGRVPTGKASALRTSDNMASILQQAEARPEHLLHNFFSGLAEAWSIMHELNQVFLSGKKQIRIFTALDNAEDAYKEIDPKTDLDGVFEFEFSANAFNTSRASMQQALMALMPQLLSPLAIQAGLANAGTVYKMLEDLGKSFGQQPTRQGWLIQPQMQNVTVEEAILAIMDDSFPKGMPMEGIPAHMAGIMEFVNSDDFGHLSQQQVALLDAWIKQLQQMMVMQQQQMARAAAAAGQGGPEGGGGQGGASADPTGGGTMVNPNELMNESLPTAGGGANVNNAG